MTIESLKALQTRIREATGPDRELDVEIARALRPGQLWCAEHPFAPEDVAPNFTTDPDGLGACVALFHEVLTGCKWTRTASGRFRVWDWNDLLASDAKPLANDCLTFVDAIIEAKAAKLEAEQEKQTEKAG